MKPAKKQPKRLSVKRVKTLLTGAGIPEWVIRAPDRFYILPSRDFLTHWFARSLRAHLSRYGVLDYSPGVNDCDDFARYACAHAAMVHARDSSRTRSGKKISAALAIAEIWYNDAKLGKHATFIALADDLGIVRLDRVKTIWRRQKSIQIRERPISKNELQSVLFCRVG